MKTILLAGILASSIAAQTLTEPPPFLQLIRKPRIGASPIRPYAEARAAVNVIGMTAVTGTPEVWLMEAHLAFASIEDLDKAVSAVAPAGALNESLSQTQEDVLPPGRTLIALYRPEWSYRSPQAIRMFPAARYFHVSIYRIRPGADAEFGELVRLRRLAMDKANLDRPDVAYQVISGAPAGTYVFLAPLTSLRTLDDGVAKMPVFAEAFGAAEERGGKKLAAEAEISREHLLFRVEPRISWVSDEFASADPGFWRGAAKDQ
jgi:hypothetical protein